ncbi:NUDIX domain-containing protein [Salinispora pacifica]|uniref:NUDIX domain-containing protein n=1 Tax=Salinispora pacifica TaxID=351187 RepID=UPI0003628CC0|nr:NUDIX domain-containing protein [Salinispora pacifica]
MTSYIDTYTDPSVLEGIRAGAAWADPTMDPTEIDWSVRQAHALVPFQVINGRPVNPAGPTGIRHGRNELGHWGEQRCADAIVIATDEHGRRWIAMVERADGHGWALPGGYVDPGETPGDAAVRELGEETGLLLCPEDGVAWEALPARVVPDPRASDEAWMTTAPSVARLTARPRADFPVLTGADDARHAEWVRADTYATLTGHLGAVHGGEVFAAHRDLLADMLGATDSVSGADTAAGAELPMSSQDSATEETR